MVKIKIKIEGKLDIIHAYFLVRGSFAPDTPLFGMSNVNYDCTKFICDCPFLVLGCPRN
jgi:hypothetical protein